MKWRKRTKYTKTREICDPRKLEIRLTEPKNELKQIKQQTEKKKTKRWKENWSFLRAFNGSNERCFYRNICECVWKNVRISGFTVWILNWEETIVD